MLDYDHLAREYARHRQVHPGVIRDLLPTARIGRSSSVLEVGCGTGNYVVALEKLAGATCSGIDPSEEMLIAARQQSETIHFEIGAAERLRFPDAAFDLVFSVDVIHHASGRQAYFHEAHRVLRPGGRVCTVTDSEWIIRNRRPLADYFPETMAADLARYPAIAELREEMGSAGLHRLVEHQEEFAGELTDSGPYRDKAFSVLHLIPQDAFQRGLARMEADLPVGPIPWVPRYVLLWGSS